MVLGLNNRDVASESEHSERRERLISIEGCKVKGVTYPTAAPTEPTIKMPRRPNLSITKKAQKSAPIVLITPKIPVLFPNRDQQCTCVRRGTEHSRQESSFVSGDTNGLEDRRAVVLFKKDTSESFRKRSHRERD